VLNTCAFIDLEPLDPECLPVIPEITAAARHGTSVTVWQAGHLPGWLATSSTRVAVVGAAT